MEAKPSSDSDEPSRDTLRTASDDPKWTLSAQLTTAPTLALPSTDRDALRRAMPRSDSEEPNAQLPSTAIEDPMRVQLRTDIDDPT